MAGLRRTGHQEKDGEAQRDPTFPDPKEIHIEFRRSAATPYLHIIFEGI